MPPRQIAEKISELLAAEITMRRNALGLSKNETATRAGLSVSFVFDIENGHSRASVETLVKLALVFGTTASEILATCEQAAGLTFENRQGEKIARDPKI